MYRWETGDVEGIPISALLGQRYHKQVDIFIFAYPVIYLMLQLYESYSQTYWALKPEFGNYSWLNLFVLWFSQTRKWGLKWEK